jgi:hypothetical protein
MCALSALWFGCVLVVGCASPSPSPKPSPYRYLSAACRTSPAVSIWRKNKSASGLNIMLTSRIACVDQAASPDPRILTLSISDNQTIDPKRRKRKLYSRKSSLFCDALQLKRVNIPFGRRGQHHHAERCRNRRRYAVRIANQFKNGRPA